MEKILTVITVRNHTICLKWRQSQNGTVKNQTVTSPCKEVMSYGLIELGRRKIIIQKSGTTTDNGTITKDVVLGKSMRIRHKIKLPL